MDDNINGYMDIWMHWVEEPVRRPDVIDRPWILLDYAVHMYLRRWLSHAPVSFLSPRPGTEPDAFRVFLLLRPLRDEECCPPVGRLRMAYMDD